MRVIITMAGKGERFRKVGYDVPKYQIKAKDKSLFEWSLESLTALWPFVKETIFVVRKEDEASAFIVEVCNSLRIPNVKIMELQGTTDGQATTALMAVQAGSLEEDIFIYNIDTYIEAGELRYEDMRGDGHIPCFNAPGEHWSFVRVNEDGVVVEVKEKKRISDNCSIGAYYFKSGELYETLYKKHYAEITSTEKYIAPIYETMLAEDKEVTMSLINNKKVHVLGTPEELEAFLKE